MNGEPMDKKWNELRGSIKSNWRELTDEDLDQIGGRLHELEGKLQTRYGWARDEARDAVNSFLKSVRL